MNELFYKEETDLRMSSMQIAELCGKEHKHVLRDIEKMEENLYSPDLDYIIIEQKERKIKRGMVRYFDLDDGLYSYCNKTQIHR